MRCAGQAVGIGIPMARMVRCVWRWSAGWRRCGRWHQTLHPWSLARAALRPNAPASHNRACCLPPSPQRHLAPAAVALACLQSCTKASPGQHARLRRPSLLSLSRCPRISPLPRYPYSSILHCCTRAEDSVALTSAAHSSWHRPALHRRRITHTTGRPSSATDPAL